MMMNGIEFYCPFSIHKIGSLRQNVSFVKYEKRFSRPTYKCTFNSDSVQLPESGDIFVCMKSFFDREKLCFSSFSCSIK